MSTLRDQLAALPSFPHPLPVLDPEQAPEDPHELFSRWFQDAIDSGQRQPHAMTFTSIDGETAVGRTLIVKDIDERGFHFSTHRTSRKGQQIEANPRASMIFFWRESGRQVRVTGVVHALSREESERDWQARPSYTGSPNPDWQLYALEPREFEFMQAREDRNHTRVEYVHHGPTWSHGTVDTPAG